MSDPLRPDEVEDQVPATEASSAENAVPAAEGSASDSSDSQTTEVASDANAGDANAGDANASDADASDAPLVDDGLAEAEAEWEDVDDQLDEDVDVEPLEEFTEEEAEEATTGTSEWYILKVQVNRESSIADALRRSVMMNSMEELFNEIVVPTEDVVEFTKAGKRRTVKKKLYPGYIMVNMILNDDTWFLVRDTSGIGDFTGSAGKPTPMDPEEVARIVKPEVEEGIPDESAEVRVAIPFRPEDRVRVKEGYFQNFEGVVESIDETNGRVTVIINIFGRSTPVDMQHWQMESL
jgi:transcriptional antiterminator NusG